MFRNTLFVFLLIFYAGLDPVVSLKEHNVTKDAADDDFNKRLNAILFLPQSDSSFNYEDNNGIAFLNISLVGQIRACTSRPESMLPPTMEKMMRRSQRHKCDCKKLLESSIFSLMSWARAMGMTAAIVSLNVHSRNIKKNEGINYYDYKLEIIDPPLLRAEPEFASEKIPLNTINMQTNQDLPQFPLSSSENQDQASSLPDVVIDADASDQNLPVYNAYSKPKLQFNDIHKFHRNKFKDFANVHRFKRKLIIEPENTEIINIHGASKEEPKNEILDIPVLKRSEQPQSIWDVLGIMSALRKSFFDNFVNSVLDPEQRMLDEEGGMNFNSLGRKRTPSLFHLVNDALQSVQREEFGSKRNGYVLIVFGGRLSEIQDPYSDLVQTIKHVRETTDPRCTLVVVTGYCPPHDISGIEKKENDNNQIPVYAAGPNHELLSKAEELFDIPIQIREAIKENKFENEKDVSKKENHLAKNSKLSPILEVLNDLNNHKDDSKELQLQQLFNEGDDIDNNYRGISYNVRKRRNIKKWLPQMLDSKSMNIKLNNCVVVFLLYTFHLQFF